MKWQLHRVGLAAHDLAVAEAFFGSAIGLGAARQIDSSTISFGDASRGLRVRIPERVVGLAGASVLIDATARHAAIEVEDFDLVVRRLDAASIRYVEAPAGAFDRPALYTLDPAQNVIAFLPMQAGDGLQAWEAAWGWGVHHVNLPAGNVRETVAFYAEIAGMTEGKWRAPAQMGNFSIDPRELAVLPLDDFNRGLHIIRPDPGFAYRNGFAHNPSIGGHPAFYVPSAAEVMQRFDQQKTLYSDAKVYAMAGMHQIYALDPTGNMIEVNQFI